MQRRPEQNILDFLNRFRNIRTFDKIFYNPDYHIFVEEKLAPPITRIQLNEYEAIKFRHSLDLLDKYPELKSWVIQNQGMGVPTTNFILEMGPYEVQGVNRTQLINDINEVYKQVAFEFLWNNYYLIYQFKMVDPKLLF